MADIVSTAVSPDLAALLQYPVQLKNTDDATSIVDAMQALAQAAPDGDTVSMIDPSHLLLPFAHAFLPFDPANDFTIVSVFGGAPLLLLTNPDKVHAATAQELIAAIKANPGVYRYYVAGQGSVLHLAVDLFLKQTCLNALATPFSGEGSMLNALADQSLYFCIVTLPGAHRLLTSNVVRALCVCSGIRLMAMPIIPTLREQGLPMYEMESWFALLAPAGISSTQASTVYSVFRRALSLAPTKRALEALGITLIMMPPDQSALIAVKQRRQFIAPTHHIQAVAAPAASYRCGGGFVRNQSLAGDRRAPQRQRHFPGQRWRGHRLERAHLASLADAGLG